MKTAFQIVAITTAFVLLVALTIGGVYIYQKQPQRSGTLSLDKLTALVSVQYDERGVPHIRAENEIDLYRALGYVHAQDRLFQMEMLRRVAKGELAAVLGPQLLESDKLFRTMGIARYAEKYAAKMNPNSPANAALLAYIDGINQYQKNRPAPLEFDLLGIRPRPFTAADAVAVSGYLAYSFGSAFKTEPVMTYIRDELGPQYLKTFTQEWQAQGVALALDTHDWQGINRVASASRSAMAQTGLPLFEGSSAWVVHGSRTASGKPLLAGDPHLGFSVPAFWYEAHLSCPDFELYGQHQALNPFALLGHNNDFGWSLTLLKNDDIDLIAETTNPQDPNQVWYQHQWVELEERTETIRVKGAFSVKINLRQSVYGPIITDAFRDNYGKKPISMRWAFLNNDNPFFQTFYELNRANTRDKARSAAAKLQAPGLNIVWASASGDIAWWAAAKLPIRPAKVNPMFILDASQGEADLQGHYQFGFNPQEENPRRGYIVSANQQPNAAVPVAGYYALPDRYQHLERQLRDTTVQWDMAGAQKMQLDPQNGYAARVLKPLLPVLHTAITDTTEHAYLDPLNKWDGSYTQDSIAATLFSQFSYELAKATFADELGEVQFDNLLGSAVIDHALPALALDADSPWWDNSDTEDTETREDTLRLAWHNTITHLQKLYGSSLLDWSWGRVHTLTHKHPLASKAWFENLFNVGPFNVPGGRETPNNLSEPIGPAPWQVSYGPSTRRTIDFGNPAQSMGINPVGQSGVWFDRHYADQAQAFAQGRYHPQHLSTEDIRTHTESTLRLRPP
jgi:penicillin amidase